MYPGEIKFLQEAFKDATKLPYHCLFLDLKPYTNEKFKVQTCMMPEESVCLCKENIIPCTCENYLF